MFPGNELLLYYLKPTPKIIFVLRSQNFIENVSNYKFNVLCSLNLNIQIDFFEPV